MSSITQEILDCIAELQTSRLISDLEVCDWLENNLDWFDEWDISIPARLDIIESIKDGGE